MSEHSVNSHYGRAGLWEQVAAGLQAAGKNPQCLTVEELAPMDQFHVRGREATLELAQVSGIRAKADILDVGGGIGGTARTLASLFACHVTVLDITDDFCVVGRNLTAATGLTERVHFQTGSALGMPFPDAWFDFVVTQHSTMNIDDKETLYREIARVLRPGGRLAMHEVVAGTISPVYYPVMWASGPEISHLRTEEETRSAIAASGLHEIAWINESDKSRAFFAARAAAMAIRTSPPSLGLQLLIGPDYWSRTANYGRNLAEHRVEVVQAVFEKPGATR